MTRIPSAFFAIFLASFLLTNSMQADEFDDLLSRYGNLETVAGTGTIRLNGQNGWQASMEGGLAIDAELSRPHITMADDAGNLYIADKWGHAIRMVSPDGIITTVAGTGASGFNGDGLGTGSQLSEPNGLFTLGDGTNYIVDLGNNRIRRLGADGQLTTVVTETAGLGAGRGLWVSPDEQLLYYAAIDPDTGSAAVRRWTPDDGASTYASGFSQLGYFDVDPTDGNLVVTDRAASLVYKILADGTKNPIAGTGGTSGGGDGFAALATGLDEVRGVAFNPDGSYFLATHRGGDIWFVDTDDMIHMLIEGDDNHTHAGDGLPLTSPGLKISEPRAITIAPNGDLLITENDYGYVRVVPYVVPEPSTLLLGLLGVVGLIVIGRQRKRQS